jgi:branched-subunit amino acid transport protein
VTALWVAAITASLGCYLLKLAGISLPKSALNQPRMLRVADFLPLAMLAALVAVQLVDGGGYYAIDWPMLAGVGAAFVALLLRRGFLTVFLTAIAVTALLRLVI